MKPVGIAMLGSGFVAEFYLQGLRDVRGQEVMINYSRTEERARQFAQRWSIPEWTTDMGKAINHEEVDLVIIGLPNFMHREAAIMSAQAKKSVVCTKPLARNAKEAKEMVEAVEKAGILHGYAETEVFSPAVIKAHEVIERGGIGEVFWVRSREAHYGPHEPWFWDARLSGGGALLDMGCHCIEAARYFIGKQIKPLEALAWGDTLIHKDRCIEAEDNALLLLRFENNTIAQAELSWSSRGGLDLRNEIYGTEGSIFTDVTRSTPITVFSLKGTGYVIEKYEAETGWVSPVSDEARVYGYHEEMRHFVECVSKNRRPRETFQDGYIVNCVIEAAYRSMKSKKWEPVEISPQFK